MDLLDILLIFLFFFTACVYLLYPFILLPAEILPRLHKKKNEDAKDLPSISVIVPTYNEDLVIESKLNSLLASVYPKNLYEVIVVDSGSTDNTCDIVREFSDRGVILLQQGKRLGKASAINFSLKEAKGELIILSDANCHFEPDVLKDMVQRFGPHTGAVLPRLVPSGNLHLWDRVFYSVHDFFKRLESDADSIFLVFGELFAFRKDLVAEIDENVASDDLEIAFIIRRKNFKIRYAPDLNVVEKIPDSQEENQAQKVRRSFGILQVMKKNMDMFLNPKYGAYGTVIFPAHALQMTVAPFFIFSFLVAFLVKILWVLPSLSYLSIMSLILAGLVLAFLLTRTRAKEILIFGYNFLATQFYIILALFHMASGRNYYIWKKISSTRTKSQLD